MQSHLLSHHALPKDARVHLWLGRLAGYAFFTAYGMQRMAVPLYVRARVCDDLLGKAACAGTPDDADKKHVSADASTWTMYIMCSMNILSMLTTSFLCRASDKRGRRPILLFTLGCMVLAAFASALVIRLRWPLWTLMACSLWAGAGGTYAGFNAVLFSSVADVTPSPAARSRAFALLEASFFLGLASGPAVGGWMMQTMPAETTFGCIAALFMCSFGCVCWMQETAPDRTTEPWQLSGGGWTASFRAALRLLRRAPPASSPGRLAGTSVGFLCLVFFEAFASATPIAQLLPLYMNLKFSFTDEAYGIYKGISDASKGVVLLLLFPPMMRCASHPLHGAMHAMRASVLILAAILLGYGLAAERWQLYAVGGLESFSALFPPATRVILSGTVGASEQGGVLGLVAIVEVFTSTVTPIMFGSLYSHTVRWSPPFTFYVMSANAFAAFLLCGRIRLGNQVCAQAGVDELCHAAEPCPELPSHGMARVCHVQRAEDRRHLDGSSTRLA